MSGGLRSLVYGLEWRRMRFSVRLLFLILVLGVGGPLTAQESVQPALSLEEAITRTLNNSPGIAVSKEQVLQAEFGEEIAAGAFDFALFSSVWSNRAAVPQVSPITTATGSIDVVKQDTTGMTVGGVQRFRNGVTISPSASVVHSSANTNPMAATGRSDVRLQISVPLLRGWGEDAANVNERVAQSALAATRDFARHNVAERVSQTALSYWTTLAAVQNLTILRDSEQRALELSDQLEDMVRVGEIEAAILEEARADLLRRRGDVVGAALSVMVNWQRLAASMGLNPEEMGSTPELAGSFPEVPPSLAWDSATRNQLVGQALARRGDFRAVMEAERTNDIYLRKAINDLRPGLDLAVRAGYSGLTTEAAGFGVLGSLTEQAAGPAGEIALNFEWPLANRSARAEVGRRRSLVRESELRSEELAIAIGAETRIAAATLKAAIDRHSVAQGTVTAFSTVVANIRRKVNTGEASITALVQNEDRFVQARQALIGAARNYATALVEVRRVTGTLIAEGAGEFLLPTSNLVTLPVIGEPQVSE